MSLLKKYSKRNKYLNRVHSIIMKYLATLRDKDIFAEPKFEAPLEYQKRVTVKAIVRNEKGEFAFVTNPIHKFYLLAGGGAESEDLEKEVQRECEEEVKYEVDVIEEIGRIHEFRNRSAKEYESVCFLVESKKEVSEDLRTKDEKKNELAVVWLSEAEAQKILVEQIEMVKQEKVEFYNTAFNIVRDHLFFLEFLK